MRAIAKIATAVMLAASLATAAQAQDVVKIGQIEAQTGTNAIYGWMGSVSYTHLTLPTICSV